jgi:hypothetical protein
MEQPKEWSPPVQMDGRSFASKLMGTASKLMGTTTSPRSERSEFILEFTGLKSWPSGEANGVCPSSGCRRLNDCPNNVRQMYTDSYSHSHHDGMLFIL